MDLTQFLALVRPELIIIVVCCYVLGLFLKSTPKIADWLIPFILLFFAIIFSILYIAVVIGEGFTAKVIIIGILQGLICAAIAVFGNQLIKQLLEKQ